MDHYTHILHTHRLRDTLPRRSVFNALFNAERPLFINELIIACPSINRTTIYRTLDTLTKIEIVQAVPLGWKQRYELTSPFRAHHHHLYCQCCDAIIDITSPEIEQLIHSLAQHHEFTVTGHLFEIQGICKRCQNS